MKIDTFSEIKKGFGINFPIEPKKAPFITTKLFGGCNGRD